MLYRWLWPSVIWWHAHRQVAVKQLPFWYPSWIEYTNRGLHQMEHRLKVMAARNSIHWHLFLRQHENWQLRWGLCYLNLLLISSIILPLTKSCRYLSNIFVQFRFLMNHVSSLTDLEFVPVSFMVAQTLESKCVTLIAAAIFSLLHQEGWLTCLKEEEFLLSIAGKEYIPRIYLIPVKTNTKISCAQIIYSSIS